MACSWPRWRDLLGCKCCRPSPAGVRSTTPHPSHLAYGRNKTCGKLQKSWNGGRYPPRRDSLRRVGTGRWPGTGMVPRSSMVKWIEDRVQVRGRWSSAYFPGYRFMQHIRDPLPMIHDSHGPTNDELRAGAAVPRPAASELGLAQPHVDFGDRQRRCGTAPLAPRAPHSQCNARAAPLPLPA